MTERDFKAFRKRLGQRIKKLRLEEGLTQEQMEDLDWLSARSFQDIESGKVNPRLSSLMVIGSKLKIDLGVLLSPDK
ncbi:MAG: helix-turn-helix transcriptional regulator [Leptospirales bacterium]|nr:helix-turn-helix transcriptional regulator [Leptospirales bacterium]